MGLQQTSFFLFENPVEKRYKAPKIKPPDPGISHSTAGNRQEKKGSHGIRNV